MTTSTEWPRSDFPQTCVVSMTHYHRHHAHRTDTVVTLNRRDRRLGVPDRRPNKWLSLIAWLLPTCGFKRWALRSLGNHIGHDVILGPTLVLNCGRFSIADGAAIRKVQHLQTAIQHRAWTEEPHRPFQLLHRGRRLSAIQPIGG